QTAGGQTGGAVVDERHDHEPEQARDQEPNSEIHDRFDHERLRVRRAVTSPRQPASGAWAEFRPVDERAAVRRCPARPTPDTGRTCAETMPRRRPFYEGNESLT